MTIETNPRTLRILGCRGIPAQHGGFETFAEQLSLYLVERDWNVIVYCQEEGRGPILEDCWRGIRRVRIPVRGTGARATIRFDWMATRHAAREPGVALTLGYNTAVFGLLHRLRRIPTAMNMDGIEWRREKYGTLERAWLWLNEWAGCRLNDRLIADHPGIGRHLQRWRVDDKIQVIPYSAEPVQSDASALTRFELEPDEYYVVIARPEPENSIREIVSAFSRTKRREKLVVLGDYGDDTGGYTRLVREAAGDGVVFLGAIYDAPIVQALRAHARAYVHGHRVGGTNPSLVESLAAGSPVLAHDNEFNRWVAGQSAFYFSTEESCAEAFDALGGMDATDLEARCGASRLRFEEAFSLERVMSAYEELLLELALGAIPSSSPPILIPPVLKHTEPSGLHAPLGPS